MKRFAAQLQKISNGLSLPQPLKSRILLEMEGDLEEVYEYYRKKGMGEEQAVKMAEEKVGASDETLALLVQLNDTAVRKYLRRFSSLTLRKLEIICWIVIVLMVGMWTGVEINHSDIFPDSMFHWIITGISLGACGLVLSKYYTISIKKDHTIHRLNAGMPLLLFLAGQSLLFGLIGFFVEIYTIFENILLKAQYITVIDDVQKLFALAAYGLLVAVGIAVVWFVLTIKTLTIEQLEKSYLLNYQVQ